MPAAFSNAVIGFEVLLALLGLVLVWQFVVSPRARLARPPSPLPAWNAEAVEFFLLLLLVMFGSFVASIAVGSLLKLANVTGDASVVFGGGAGQFGMLAGVLVYASRSPGFRSQAPRSAGYVLRSGVVTFLISLPILDATSKAWELLLRAFGIPAERQDLIRMFAEAKSPAIIIGLVGLAILVAPITEELVFRAGLFRFFRTRAPRFLAFLLPAVIFAALHTNWTTLEGFTSFAPLVVLALLFSAAYERTGHIGTTIVAHALFNLNTIMLIFSGVGT